jgi:hypothetical protein
MYFATTPAGTTTGVNSLILAGNQATFSGGVVTNGGASGLSLLMTGPAAADNFIRYATTSGRLWTVGVPGTGGQANDYWVFDTTAGAVRFQIDAAGVTYNTSGSWSTVSDPRLKTDMAPYASGLTQILALEPITYRYNGEAGTPCDDENVTRYGLDAQATQAVMPELVGEHGGYLTLDNGPLIYALCNACKELKAENTALAARVAALEGSR